MKFPPFNHVAADVSPLHLKSREGRANSRRLLRSGSDAQRGIALVVTLILLSVITFLAVAFLFLSRRERASVITAVDQSVSRLGAEAATERAKVEILAPIRATGSGFNYGLSVSRNFIDPAGYDPANLYYNPRPPVFITDKLTGTTDFRFWLDLNRNGRFETNGLLPELTGDAALPFFDANGNWTASLADARISNFVGDPEWIGILDRPDRAHSPNNKFVSRIAYLVVPSGMALDINNIYNAAGSRSLAAANEGFIRNQGAGTWELNLAAFLADLNTNYWGYQYDAPRGFPNTGSAFLDAQSILGYRYGFNYANQRSVNEVLPLAGAAFASDLIDGYADGVLQWGRALTNDNDNVSLPWAGAENINHVFTSQDLIDGNPARGMAAFANRLRSAGQVPNGSSYNTYTYYRLLSQLGTDSGPEPAGKLHLNYANVDAAGRVVPDAQTNFNTWGALEFFTNAADKLLRATFASSSENRQLFGVRAVISLTNVPVVISNQFVYSPSLHRVFQIAANIYDSSRDHTATRGADLPSVFRPRFEVRSQGGFQDIYIQDWVEVAGLGAAELSKPLDMNDGLDRQTVQSAGVFNGNLYGVPWVIGAKKGFPNFNEFAMQSVAQISRKLQVRRANGTAKPSATNQMFTVGISNLFAFEAWNSYRANYNRDVQINLANDMLLNFSYTNDVPLDPRGNSTTVRMQLGSVTNLAANRWSGYGNQIAAPAKESFVVPLTTNINFLPDSIFRTDSGATVFTTNIYQGAGLVYGYEQTKRFHIPQFTLAVSNRLRFIMVDTATGRIVDYVHLNDVNGIRNLTSELNDGSLDVDSRERSLWATNRPGGNSLSTPPQGVLNQIQIALGNIPVADWNSYGQGQASGETKKKAIDAFRVFMGLGAMYYPGTVNTNTDMQVPFTPTRRTSQYLTWQANDPLVHYTAGDLLDLSQATGIRRELPSGPLQPIANIGDLNDRFEPWGGNPQSSAKTTTSVDKFSLLTKDPGVRASDDWNFPANKYPTVGWLGRVHRGTPWQTVYLKASTNLNDREWTRWTGNRNQRDARKTMPVNDRVIFDVFTTAFNADSTRGQLNVNQPGLAAWSAALGGVIALRNIATDDQLKASPPQVQFDPVIIDPAGVGITNSPMGRIWEGITAARAQMPGGYFARLADVLSAPELTEQSPLLNLGSDGAPTTQQKHGIDDATYERIPQMIMGLLRGEHNPRFTIYAYGQALKPANNSIVRSGTYFGLCTNYQITAEFATRTVVRIDGTPDKPRAVVESFNILPPE